MVERREVGPRKPSKPGAVSVRFEAVVVSLRGRTILRLPDVASKALPSRGQVAVHGAINGRPLACVVEPDGEFGHWMNVDASAGETALVELQPAAAWPEPSVPADFSRALSGAPEEVRALWDEITPMARWEWVRWVDETRNPATRQKRVEVGLSKLSHGKRRPCCFNLASCTDPELSRSGKLVRE